MHEIHNLASSAVIADLAHRRAASHRTPTRIPPSVRWWRRSDVRTGSTHVRH